MASLTLEKETPPLRLEESGAVRVGNSRVLLELVIWAFQDGATPEVIVEQYPTLNLADVYSTVGYYLRHQEAINVYLASRDQQAKAIREKLAKVQPDSSQIRARLLARRNAQS